MNTKRVVGLGFLGLVMFVVGRKVVSTARATASDFVTWVQVTDNEAVREIIDQHAALKGDDVTVRQLRAALTGAELRTALRLYRTSRGEAKQQPEAAQS